MQLGAAAGGRGCNWARPQFGAAGAWCRCNAAGLRLCADTASAACCCSGAVPQVPTAPSLSLQLYAERDGEHEGSLPNPLVVLSPSPSQPPHLVLPKQPSPSPFSHLFLSLRPFSISPSNHLSLPFFRYLFLSPLSRALFLSRLPFPPAPPSAFLTLPFPLSRYPCDLPQPFCLSIKRQEKQE